MSGIVHPRPAATTPGRAGVQTVVDPIPAHPRPEIAECLGREPARNHLEHTFERSGGQVAVGISGAADPGGKAARPAVHCRRRQPAALGTSRQPVGTRRASTLPSSIARPSTSADSRRSAPVLAIRRPLLTRPTRCPARPTRHEGTAGHAAGGLDLADEVDRPHVDSQLERGRFATTAVSSPCLSSLLGATLAARPGSGCRDALLLPRGNALGMECDPLLSYQLVRSDAIRQVGSATAPIVAERRSSSGVPR